jgi:predicted kinase
MPAVGKSSLVAELGPRLNASQLSRDQVRLSAGPFRRLVDIVGFRLLRRRLGIVQRWATTGLLVVVNSELEVGRSVIVEALAEPELRDELFRLAISTGSRFVILECWCSNETEYERRLATRPKSWVELVRRLSQTHQPAADAIRIDTSESPATTAAQVLETIGR